MGGDTSAAASFTSKQGQYLAFIYWYTKLNRVAPAEADFVRYFNVSAPSVHQMIKILHADGWISRTPGEGRSIRLRVPREHLPDLE
ncbi:LexA family protein [Longimicrobium sp.]|uniref:LexA family protein n=1 Tax=Longimicrobium sp. TaxID=2029185 RepID=UPI003B3B9001